MFLYTFKSCKWLSPETTVFVSATARTGFAPLRADGPDLGLHFCFSERGQIERGQPVGFREELIHTTAAHFLADQPFNGLRCKQPGRLGFARQRIGKGEFEFNLRHGR